MSRESLFSMLKKIAYGVLVLQLVIMVLDRMISLPQDGVDFIRLTLIPIFIFTSLALPWIKPASFWFKAIGLIGIALYLTGFFIPRYSNFVVIAIFVGVLMLLLSDYFGRSNDVNQTKNRVINVSEQNHKKEQDGPAYPLPGPSKRAGEMKTYAKYYASMILAFINPFQFVQMIIQTVGLISTSELKSFEQKGNYTLPFTKEWLIFNGGIDKKDSHSWDIINQRYAYDYVMADTHNNRHKNDGDKLNDYYCYGQNIVSPGDGQVIKVRDGIRDYPHPGTMMVDFLAQDFRGNFIIIKHEEKEYSVLAHFIPGSIEVKKGDIVKRGQLLGKCGNSGHSTEPHLHFHFQDHPNFYFGRGLPIKFSNLIVNGEYKKESYLKKGEKVEPA